MAAAKRISVDAAKAAPLSELGGTFTIKEQRKNNTEGFFFLVDNVFSLSS